LARSIRVYRSANGAVEVLKIPGRDEFVVSVNMKDLTALDPVSGKHILLADRDVTMNVGVKPDRVVDEHGHKRPPEPADTDWDRRGPPAPRTDRFVRATARLLGMPEDEVRALPAETIAAMMVARAERGEPVAEDRRITRTRRAG